MIKIRFIAVLFSVLTLLSCSGLNRVNDDIEPLKQRITTLEAALAQKDLEADMDAAAHVGASAKLSALTELASAPAESDELYINDGGTSKKITSLNLMRSLEAARTSYEIHSDNLDSDLGSIAALTTTAYGRALLELANEAALQALITSPWAVADGGTGAGDAPTALVNLGIDASESEIDTPLDGALVTLTEFRELETIGDETFSADQWGYVANADQPTKTTDAVVFRSISPNSQDFTGTDDTSVNAAFMTDSTATWVADELIGFSIENTTQSSDGIITDNTSTTVTATMSSGDWDSGDGYEIAIHGGSEFDLYPDTDLRCEMVEGATVQVDTSAGFGSCLTHVNDWNWDTADAEVSTKPCIAMHCDPYGNAAASSPTKIMFKGHIRNDSWTWVYNPGASSPAFVYLGDDGLPTQTAPSDSGDIIQIIGVATSADTFYFNPQFNYVLRE